MVGYLDSLFAGSAAGPGNNGDISTQLPRLDKPPGTEAVTPPPGFTAQQWKQLMLMAKKNPSIAELMKKYTANGGKNPDDAWRRVMPTDTSQLLRQLSYNAGEMGMPGGYVGAIQLPAYGETQPPVNNPDMSSYGQAPGLGEATFYQQSMKGGMAPIAAMSPLGVPQGWNPGGDDLGKQLKDYLDKLGGNGNGGGGGGGGGGGSGKPGSIGGGGAFADEFKASFEAFLKNSLGGGFNGVFAGFPSGGGGRGGGKKNKGDGNGSGGTANKPGQGVPIKRPYGY